MTSIICGICGVAIAQPQPGSITSGYGTTPEGSKICYACCANRDKEYMRSNDKITLYLTGVAPHRNRTRLGIVTSPDWKITNWPGSLQFRPMGQNVKVGRHNMAGVRYDVWFVFEGFVWHGVSFGQNTELLHCCKTKMIDPSQPQPRKHYIGLAGLHGYMPNYHTVGETRGSVADDLGSLHELSQRQIKMMRSDQYFELDLHIHGNEYCEITECDCGGAIESHADDPQ